MSSVASGAKTEVPLSPFAVPECAACMARRCHTDEENRAHHPFSGHGYTKEQGWSHPQLAAEAAARESANAALKSDVILAGGK